MVVNAHCKLAQFLEEHDVSASERVKKFGRLMSELVTEIFFVPQDGFVNVAVLPSPHSQSETLHAPNIAGVNVSQTVSPTGMSQVQVPGYSQSTFGTVEEAIADPAAGDNFLGRAEAPEIPDADGLTNSEFELVASKAQDPYLDPKERANAAMMMLCGTRRKCTLL